MLVITDKLVQERVNAMYAKVAEIRAHIQAKAELFDRFQYELLVHGGGGKREEYLKEAVMESEECFTLQDLQETLDGLLYPIKCFERWQNDHNTITKLMADGDDFYFCHYHRKFYDGDEIADINHDAKIMRGEVDWCMNGGLINHGASEGTDRWGTHT